jgi:intergrase/recombinase
LVRTLALRACSNIDLNHETTLNLDEFDHWVKSKYAESYHRTIMCYVKRYYKFVFSDNLRDLDLLPQSIKNNCIKSLTILSKYLGVYDNFASKLKNHGIKLSSPSTFNAFLRIMNGNNSDILKWYTEVQGLLRNNERTFLKYLLLSGLRKNEAIKSFNRIIELAKNTRLSEYYDSNLNCLCHFKYPKDFIRKTKNCFITFITENLAGEIANSESITYEMIRKRLLRNKQRCRINELRDFFGTYLLRHGILEQEINLLQGRIPPSIFVKHYWTPKLSELRDRTLTAITQLEQTLN